MSRQVFRDAREPEANPKVVLAADGFFQQAAAFLEQQWHSFKGAGQVFESDIVFKK